MEKDKRKKNVKSHQDPAVLPLLLTQTEIIVLWIKKTFKNIVSNQMVTLDGITHLPRMCLVIILNKSLKLETSCQSDAKKLVPALDYYSSVLCAMIHFKCWLKLFNSSYNCLTTALRIFEIKGKHIRMMKNDLSTNPATDRRKDIHNVSGNIKQQNV